jgi:hypothetical protein
MLSILQKCNLQMWFPAPLSEGELHRRKLRFDKYKPLAGRLMEFYESDSSVEANKDTDAEAGADLGAGIAKSRRRTRSTVVKKSASAVAAAISAVKDAEQKKKKRNRKAASPPAVITPSIPTPRSREVESEEEEKENKKDEAAEELPVPEDQVARRPDSPAAKRKWSWCRRRWRMLSDVDWRCSVVLQRRRQGCLRLLSLGCFGRRLGFRL